MKQKHQVDYDDAKQKNDSLRKELNDTKRELTLITKPTKRALNQYETVWLKNNIIFETLS